MDVELSDGVRIRLLRPADAESLARHMNDHEVWSNLRDRVPFLYSVADAVQFIDTSGGEDPVSKFAIDVGGEVVGACGVERGQDVHRRTVEIGFWIGRGYWGRGIMSRVVPELVAWVMATFSPLRVEAQVFGFNPASARVLEKCGFEREACLKDAITKAGRTADLWIYAKFP